MSGGPIALVPVHYQNEVLHPDGKIPFGARDPEARERLITAATALFAAARAAGAPILHVRISFKPDLSDLIANCEMFSRVRSIGAMVENSWGAAFYEGLGPEHHEAVFHHTRLSGFHGTTLAQALGQLGISRLAICGVATPYAVESTVRAAVDLGYEVMIPQDACAAATREAHEASLANLRPLAQILTAAEIAARFAGIPP